MSIIFRISRVIFLVFSLFLLSVSGYAQDIVTLRSGEQIKAKVLEISDTEIKYKRYEHQDGPTRSVSLATVFSIDYENGMREVIKQTSEPRQTQTASQASRQQTTSSAGYDYALLHVYRKGRVGGSAINYDLHVDRRVICRVKNKWYEPIKIDKEGEITLWAQTEARTELPITVEFGQEYYIRCGLDFGVVVGRPYLELVDEETGELEIASIQGTVNQSSRQQTTSQPSTQKNAINSYKGAALGVNFMSGFTFKESVSDFGLGVNFSQTFSIPFRLAGEFDILWGNKYPLTTRWIDVSMYGHYLFLSGGKNFATYPLVGLGYVNYKVKIILWGVPYEESVNLFAATFGWGVEGRYNHFFYGAEYRFKIVNGNKIGINDLAYRMHLVARIGYKF